MSKTAVFFLGLLFLAAGATALVFALRQTNDSEPIAGNLHTERVLPAEPLESFQLTAQTGKPFDSQRLAGEVWIASFFFASCPATCRQQNEAIAALQAKYGKRGVKFLSISVDPATDDPGKLHSYAESFQADPEQWYFLTDRSQNIDYIRRVGQEMFAVPVTTRGHADTLILVDRAGKIHDYYNWKKPERIVELQQDIETMLSAATTSAASELPITKANDAGGEPSAADGSVNE